ncbi:MAG: hypothetical protein M3542_09145 [Acidobacteriota bacterium]|nr:hypothetical protein [Acidobacteriota bacterium]
MTGADRNVRSRTPDREALVLGLFAAIHTLGLETLRLRGWRCGLGVPVPMEVPRVVIARVAPS